MLTQNRFGYFLLVSWLFAITCEWCGYLLGVVADTPQQGAELFPLLMVPGILTSGILIAYDSLPWVVRWVHWATPFSYACINTVILEFFYDDAKINCLRPISPQLDYFLVAVRFHLRSLFM